MSYEFWTEDTQDKAGWNKSGAEVRNIFSSKLRQAQAEIRRLGALQQHLVTQEDFENHSHDGNMGLEHPNSVAYGPERRTTGQRRTPQAGRRKGSIERRSGHLSGNASNRYSDYIGRRQGIERRKKK